MNKHWYTSKTLWFGVAVFCAAILSKLGVGVDLPDDVSSHVDTATVVMIVDAVFMILRKITKQPIGK